MKTNRMKHAPAPLWAPLRSQLSGLEVGESGVLRLPVEVPEGESLDDLRWLPFATPPLRPGRYWVPEEWRMLPHLVVEYRAGGDPDNYPWRRVSEAVHEPRKWAAWQSPRHLPARAARLACSVGEERVEAWCAECDGRAGVCAFDECTTCGGEGTRDAGGWPCGDCDGTGMRSDDDPCPACGGTPPPTWVYEVERTEVER